MFSRMKACAIVQRIVQDIVPGAADEDLAAPGQDVSGVGVDVALVDVVEAGIERDAPCGVQRLRRVSACRAA